MDAITLLTTDHETVKKILKLLISDQCVEEKLDEEFSQLKFHIKIHEMIEEKIFYPALEKFEDAKDWVMEAYEEHHLANQIIEEMDGLEQGSDEWIARLRVLKENVEHHIQEEERELFPRAKQLFSEEELVEYGRQMEALKKEAQFW